MVLGERRLVFVRKLEVRPSATAMAEVNIELSLGASEGYIGTRLCYSLVGSDSA